MLGVVQLVTPKPLDNTFPPTEFAYQSTVEPDGGVADKDTVPANIRLPLTAVGAAGALAAVQDI